jgi:hypothetical protein
MDGDDRNEASYILDNHTAIRVLIVPVDAGLLHYLIARSSPKGSFNFLRDLP